MAVTLSYLMTSFSSQDRSLLRNADVEESGTIRINTRTGAHLTSEKVLQALKLRNELRHRLSIGPRIRNAEELRDYKEAKADIRHLIELAPEQVIRRRRLSETRKALRAGQTERATLRIVIPTTSNTDDVVRDNLEKHFGPWRWEGCVGIPFPG